MQRAPKSKFKRKEAISNRSMVQKLHFAVIYIDMDNIIYVL